MKSRRDKNGHLKSGIRLPGWDYCQPWIYMITLTVKERRPILGKIIVSRRASESEIAAIVEKALLHGERGGVAVSGCISPGEQAVAKAVREASLPLIAIIPRGFGPYFKPQGDYLTACADGKLLMLSPFAPITKKEPLTRERCFAINALGAEICGIDSEAISYLGSKPTTQALLHHH